MESFRISSEIKTMTRRKKVLKKAIAILFVIWLLAGSTHLFTILVMAVIADYILTESIKQKSLR